MSLNIKLKIELHTLVQRNDPVVAPSFLVKGMRCTIHKPFNRVSYRKLNSDIPNVVLFFCFIFFFKKELAIVFSNFLVSRDERKRRQPTGEGLMLF